MGWLTRAATAVERAFSPRAELTESLPFDEMLRRMGVGIETASGVEVSFETALRYTTCLICIRVLAESVASLPLILYRRRADGGRDRATDHPLYPVLHDLANGWNTSFELLEGTMVNLATRGNGYCYVERNRRGQVIGLVPLNPDGVTIEQARDWSPAYEVVMPDNVRTKLPRSQVHHIRGPLPAGYVGRSMIRLARDAIGLGVATERFGSKLFANGVRASGVLKHPKTLSKPAQDRLLAQIQERHQGVDNMARPILLEEGLEWTQLSINPDDAQFLETRKFQRSEIAGIFRVPAHLVNDLERATFSNIEHQTLDFVVHSLRPWLVRWEQAINRDLLTPAERGEYFVEFLVDGLLRGDFKTRMEGYAIQIQNGISNPNEIRARENMNARDGGDEYWRPSNMMGDEQAAALAAAMSPQARRALAVRLKAELATE